MVAPGRIVILNGASSSGKTSIATAFCGQRAEVGELWFLVGIDDFLSKLPVQWLDLGYAAGPGRHAADGLRFVSTASGVQLSVGAIGRRVLRAYHLSAVAAARCGLDVIVDDVVIDAVTAADWFDVLGDLRPAWVNVHCSPELGIERERARGDRPLGMNAAQTPSVRRQVEAAFEIDTTSLDVAGGLAALTTGLRDSFGW